MLESAICTVGAVVANSDDDEAGAAQLVVFGCGGTNAETDNVPERYKRARSNATAFAPFFTRNLVIFVFCDVIA